MHIGNLRTALFEYLVAKSQGGTFIMRLEDTDTARYVPGAEQIIYDTLKTAGLKYDEGPGVGGDYGPYVQSRRKTDYLVYAEELVKRGGAYYCFCDKERLAKLHETSADGAAKYDRFCLSFSKEEVAANLAAGKKYVIRQLIPEGQTTFTDLVYGDITVDNSEMEDQILIKSDLLPTYNFANVVDDHLMKITHVVRGSEYLSSTPKYNLLYEALGWEIPQYIHLPLIVNENGEKLAKRKGDMSFEQLVKIGFLPEAIINFIALLGWSPQDNREILSLQELTECFNIKGLSKSPSKFDIKKLLWMNGEYFKKMPDGEFFEMAKSHIANAVKRKGIDAKKLAEMVKTRIELLSDIPGLLDFIDELPNYDISLFTHKKMKTDSQIAGDALNAVMDNIRKFTSWDNTSLYETLVEIAQDIGYKNSQVLWPVRTALSGKPTSPCGASELMELLGREETFARIINAMNLLGVNSINYVPSYKRVNDAASKDSVNVATGGANE
jgi:glutamyl-tRNA synthetase